MIECQQLSAWYGDSQILNNIDITIPENSITAVIGPSGCGKTTFLSCLNSMLSEYGGYYTGNILLDGRNIRGFRLDELRRKIGLVFQQPAVFPLSVYENIVYGPRFYGIKQKDALNQLVNHVLEKAALAEELKDKLHIPAVNLSGGQQQRLCIARSLSVQPDILLLDEPCSALDIKSSARIEQLLRDLAKTMTIVIVTHNLQQARRIADNVIFMLNGQVIEAGSHIFTAPHDERTQGYIEGMFG